MRGHQSMAAPRLCWLQALSSRHLRSAPVHMQGTSMCCPGPFTLGVFPVASSLEVVTQRRASSLYLLLSTSFPYFLSTTRLTSWRLQTRSRLEETALQTSSMSLHSGPGLAPIISSQFYSYSLTETMRPTHSGGTFSPLS